MNLPIGVWSITATESGLRALESQSTLPTQHTLPSLSFHFHFRVTIILLLLSSLLHFHFQFTFIPSSSQTMHHLTIISIASTWIPINVADAAYSAFTFISISRSFQFYFRYKFHLYFTFTYIFLAHSFHFHFYSFFHFCRGAILWITWGHLACHYHHTLGSHQWSLAKR